MCPGTKIIAVSTYDDPSVVQCMLEAGAAGYVLKQNASRELIDAIRAVAAGTPIPDRAMHRIPEPFEHAGSQG
jgi:DNA-binding NarL/FixJ family response regulator